jgi:hypothetical protein
MRPAASRYCSPLRALPCRAPCELHAQSRIFSRPAKCHNRDRSDDGLLLNSGAPADCNSGAPRSRISAMTLHTDAHMPDKTLRKKVTRHVPSFAMTLASKTRRTE